MAAYQYPYLPVLDDILQSANVESQLPIGTVEVPLELLVGTKTAGRTAAFASNFMPLLDPDTEFASKWISLCQAHVEEGIRDPIRCFEYLGRFYVQEGNKRVSVLKYFEADSISATVTRVMPQYSDNKEIRLYYEFVEYYPLCGLYTLTFTQEGSFARLQKALGKAPGEKWSDDDRADIVSLYNWIKKSYHARGGENMRTTVGDVLLLLIRVYTLADLKKRSPAELTKALDAIWDDVLAIEQPVPVKLSTKPAEPDQVKLIDRILPAAIRPGAAPKTSRSPLCTSARPKPAPGPASTNSAAASLTRSSPARSRQRPTITPFRAKTPTNWSSRPLRKAPTSSLPPVPSWWALRCARRSSTPTSASSTARSTCPIPASAPTTPACTRPSSSAAPSPGP